ncbi:uncharacterized protein PITG_13938 [Phytophthora infestans T30-4]|uniref:Uncharacterized protein n=1 Tax=Phytophthora infestans (strain T30-4) TaxID=403677 RepID=D0NN54_PHYIT|nr:uncharacterized protein PITG_13938 [Phytophthora infestans T30-4]EEY61961.1 hypothetical protein PITG_13938 [Phytophthora infestans T30-4]|eukprot:XP_002899601.1 hypothetical protein PITG_13938 [Phytophthora infestans T30-4]
MLERNFRRKSKGELNNILPHLASRRTTTAMKTSL